jgi:hypothetical protein
MPVARYFLFVGGVLLALLLAIDAFSPPQAVVASEATPSVDKGNKTVLRIRSDQKLPERVVYDTSLATIVPAPVMAAAQAVAPPAPALADASAADASAQARARETFAQFVPAEAKKPEPPRKRKIAKSRPAQPMQVAPQMRVAQQSQFGFFGGSNWSNTW